MTTAADMSAPTITRRRRALVLSGGGIKFATHVGVMNEMSTWKTTEGPDWLKWFDALVGTSAGALYAGAMAAGYDPARIAMLARLFAQPGFGSRLFDYNYRGFAAAYLKYDTAAALGAIRGDRILSLLETLFSRKARQTLQTVSEESARSELKRLWSEQKREKRKLRPREYYADQVSFEDCPDLFLIGTNALTGQKTVFCHVGDRVAEEAREKLSFDDTDPAHTYVQSPAELDQRVAEGYAKLGMPVGTFSRVDQRAYWRYDRKTYGEQLPIALAVRASLSIPVVFEPLRLVRSPSDGKQRQHEDLFVDGGVDDGFSLEVAVDHEFAAAQDVFGVSLGNLGYRIADQKAVGNIAALLVKTMDYMGDAVLDMERQSAELRKARITVLNAYSASDAQLTNTNAITDLITEGKAIARSCWEALHPPGAGLEYGTVDLSRVFRPSPICVFLSDAAVFNLAGLKTSLTIENEQDDRERVSVWSIVRLPLVTSWWYWMLQVAALVTGFLVLLGLDDLAQHHASLFGWSIPAPEPSLVTLLAFGLVFVALTRLVAYLIWLRDRD